MTSHLLGAFFMIILVIAAAVGVTYGVDKLFGLKEGNVEKPDIKLTREGLSAQVSSKAGFGPGMMFVMTFLFFLTLYFIYIKFK